MKCADCSKLSTCPKRDVWGCRFPDKMQDLYPMDTRINAIASDIIGQLVAESVDIQSFYTESTCFIVEILRKWDKELKKVEKIRSENSSSDQNDRTNK
jgi:hypothetical protein